MESRRLRSDETAISAVFGAVLMVGLVVALAVVAGTFFIGFGQGTPDEVPSVRATAEWDTGGDGTFANTNATGFCSGGDWEGNDKFSITFAAAETLKEHTFEVRVGGSKADSVKATMATCAGGSAGLDWATSPADVQGGKTIEVVESKGSNAIQPGEKVMIVWEDPETSDEFVVWQTTVPNK